MFAATNPAGALGRHRLPLVLQAESAECSLACIAMVAGYHGFEVDMNTLRRRYPISLRGARLKDMIGLSDQMGLSSRAVRLEISALRHMQCPAILHWNLNHFVVLRLANRRGVVIHDPAYGVRRISYAEVSKHFTGVALELTPSPSFQVKRDVRRLRITDLWTNVRGMGRALGQVFFISIILQLFALTLPLQIQLVVDEALTIHDTDLLLVVALSFVGVVLIHGLTEALRARMLSFFGAQLQLQLSGNLFHHLLRLPFRFFERRHIGDVISRFRSTERINEVFSHKLTAVVLDGLVSIATVTIMFVYDVRLALIALTFTALYATFRFSLLILLRRLTLEEISFGAREQTTFIETVRAIQSIRLFCAEPFRETTWRNQFADRVRARVRVADIEIVQEACKRLIMGFQGVALLYAGSTMVISGQLSIGMLLAFIAYSLEFQGRSTAFIQQLADFKLLSLHLDRLADIVHTPVELSSTAAHGSQRVLEGHLELRGVSFKYSDDEPLLLSQIDLEVEPGEFVAIAGASGCGKTTIFKILLGLIEPQEGDVLIDGLPLHTFGLSSHRRQIAAVMQDDQLLSGTIADNISFFDTTPDPDRIHESAMSACIHSDIVAMPMAYDSMIGDMGTMLSGGQKQRILLARALYRQPAVLLVDEGTAHLDVGTEQLVNKNLKTLDITRIVIAHRPDTLAAADRIVFMEHGRMRQIDARQISRVV